MINRYLWVKKKHLFIPFFLLLLALFVLYRWSRVSAPPAPWVQVSLGTIEPIIAAEGRVEPIERVEVTSENGGTLAEVLVDVGDEVKADQVLARFEAEEPRERWIQAKARLESLQARLRLLTEGARPEDLEQALSALKEAIALRKGAEKSYQHALSLYRQRASEREMVTSAESRWRSAQEQVRQAQSALNRLKNTPTPEELEEAQANLDSAQANLSRVESAYLRAQNLYNQGAISKDALEQAELHLKSAQAQVKSAQARWENLRKTPREEDLQMAQARLAEALALAEGARRSLENAQELYRDRTLAQSRVDEAWARLESARYKEQQALAYYLKLRNGPHPREIEALQKEIAIAQADLRLAQSHLKNVVIRSPVDGIVLKRFHHPHEVVGPREPLLLLGRKDALEVEAEVDETDVPKVRVGQQARVTTDAYPWRTFLGRVVRIGGEVGRKRLRSEDPTAMESDARVLPVRIRLPKGTPLKLGTSCQISILVGRRSNVPVVPRLTVFRHSGKPFVEVYHQGQIERREVVLGEYDEDYVEIKRGLRIGEKVLLREENRWPKP